MDNRIQPVNRVMTSQEMANYARALVRAGECEVKAAVNAESSRIVKISLLNEVHKLNPSMAENVARESL